MSSYYDNFMGKYVVVYSDGNVVGYYNARTKSEAINMAQAELEQNTIDGEKK